MIAFMLAFMLAFMIAFMLAFMIAFMIAFVIALMLALEWGLWKKVQHHIVITERMNTLQKAYPTKKPQLRLGAPRHNLPVLIHNHLLALHRLLLLPGLDLHARDEQQRHHRGRHQQAQQHVQVHALRQRVVAVLARVLVPAHAHAALLVARAVLREAVREALVVCIARITLYLSPPLPTPTQSHVVLLTATPPQPVDAVVAHTVVAAHPLAAARTRQHALRPVVPRQAITAVRRGVEGVLAHAAAVAAQPVLTAAMPVARRALRTVQTEVPALAVRAVGVGGEARVAHAAAVARHAVLALAAVAISAGVAVGAEKARETVLALHVGVSALGTVGTLIGWADVREKELCGVNRLDSGVLQIDGDVVLA